MNNQAKKDEIYMLNKIVTATLFPKAKTRFKQKLNNIVKQFYQDIQQMSKNYDYENLDNIYNKAIDEIKKISSESQNSIKQKSLLLMRLKNKKRKT